MKPEGEVSEMRLGEFILKHMEQILAAWEDHARRCWVGPVPDQATLRNHAEEMLRAVVADMASDQGDAGQRAKSEGKQAGEDSEINRAAVGHAIDRVNDGFDIGSMVAEFRALRTSVSRIWRDSVPAPHGEQAEDMERFNEAVDQLVATSVEAYTKRVDRSRRLFLGILGHDLRQPLQSMRMFTEILIKRANATPAETQDILSRMSQCCDGMSDMLRDVLDFTSSRLGAAIPVKATPTDLEEIFRDILTEVEVAAPESSFTLDVSGDLKGEWDLPRLRQMISNLLSNSTQHGATDQPITVTLRGSAEEVTLAVHNMGEPIPEKAQANLFDPLVRLAKEEGERPTGSIGLGLYICRQIAVAHGGDIELESSAEKGTTFTVKLPKRPAAGKGKSR